ncbi:NF-kappa-B inhibitor-like protein 1 [Electrophorus electricus]|uniref:NF-kappa-B inhibitor-like protein 1 n=1 Tax=Electrophorus electricus TaxID=8005 RepID=UPI0015D0C00E|nr:NF-kappa-B inhibitor-like protein 1 [Electrophorus electricus]
MVSRQQSRVLRYVRQGRVQKLGAYLRKHRRLQLNFSQGRRHRSLLHVACSQGDAAVLRVLLEHGADPLRPDRRGDTALHLAARRLRKHGTRDYNDVLLPLREYWPDALETPNHAGVTPRALLQGIRLVQGATPSEGSPQRADPEHEWREKLRAECQDEFSEMFGQYDDDFLRDDDEEEDFGNWAERIRREYVAKQQARAQRGGAYSRPRKAKHERAEEEEKEARRRREFHARQEKEHREYLERAARKHSETQQGRKTRYEERCAATFHSSASSSGADPTCMLGYDDIPWPAPRGSLDEMLAVMLHGADRSDVPAFRKLLRRQQALWHPDKFSQRCGRRLLERDRQTILDTVTALSQELNRLAQSLR